MPEVQRLFTTFHANHYKIYNLCAERGYDLEGYFESVERFPFYDHNPCALQLIEQFCNSVFAYLAEDPENVVGIHCKAGKGRTGLMISCYLLHCGNCERASDALDLFARERTHNGKGVTIPSQIRWVYYYEQLLRRDQVMAFAYKITHIRFITVPNFDPAITGGGCDPYVKVLTLTKKARTNDIEWVERGVFNQQKRTKKVKKFYPSDGYVLLDLEEFDVLVKGDVKLIFYDRDQYGSDDKMFHLWFHTAFVEENYLMFEKVVIDKACKDKNHRTFDEGFKVEIFLHRVDEDVRNLNQEIPEDGTDEEGTDAEYGTDDDEEKA